MARFAMNSESISFQEHNEWALSMWRRMDRDHSMSITRQELDCEEFRTAVRSALLQNGTKKSGGGMGGATYERAEISTDQAINFCLRKADLNHDSSLSFEEFRSFTMCLRTETLAKHTANLIFAFFDLDQDARICEAEFREIFRFFLGHNPTEVEFQSEWSKLDTQGKQQVTRPEFIRWLQQCKNPIFKRHAPPVEPGSSLVDGVLGATGDTGDSKQTFRRSTGSLNPKPLWNERFNGQKNINGHAPVSRRNYFMRPQSLPELQRHYESRKGFAVNRTKLLAPQSPAPVRVLSTDTGRCFAFQPGMALPGGKMQCHKSGQVKQWEDHWQTPACVKKKLRAGSLDFRCPGQPAEWMFAGDGEQI